MPERPTRREALVTLAAGAAAPAVLGTGAAAAQTPVSYAPRVFSPDEFRLVTTLVERIIPASDTPGAAAAGVDRYIDEELAVDEKARTSFLEGLRLLENAGFGDKSGAEQIELLAAFSTATGARGAFFQQLKGMTVDGYYSTEIGLVQELGYQGNDYLREFPGCQDEEHA